jgi:hypothetical protein
MKKLMETVFSMWSVLRLHNKSIWSCELIWQLEASKFGRREPDEK